MMTEALEEIGDTYGIYGFSGHGRQQVEFYLVKHFNERLTGAVKGRVGAIEPQALDAHGHGAPPRGREDARRSPRARSTSSCSPTASRRTSTTATIGARTSTASRTRRWRSRRRRAPA